LMALQEKIGEQAEVLAKTSFQPQLVLQKR
jgi:hypothetical protein